VCGHDRDTIAVLLFISRVHAGRHAGLPDADHATLATHPAIVRFVETALAEHNAGAAGTSTKILRFSLLAEPPNRAAGEIADKGSINQRRALELRADAIAALYAEPARS
jgi:feruloyl-CoA synthase